MRARVSRGRHSRRYVMVLSGSASLGCQSDTSDALHYVWQYYWPVWKVSCFAETRAENEAKSVKAIIDMPDHVIPGALLSPSSKPVLRFTSDSHFSLVTCTYRITDQAVMSRLSPCYHLEILPSTLNTSSRTTLKSTYAPVYP
jgi:hypothetical protein